jgi:Tfp pilus assembly protein PilO
MNRRRYVLLGALFIITVVLFQTYYLGPKSETIREEIQTEYGTLQKYEAFLKGSGITEAETQSALNDMKAIEKRLIPEKSEFLSSANMQRVVADLTERAGLSVQSIRPLNAVKEKNFLTIPVYFEGNGSIKQLSDFLKAVEAGPVMLKIDKMSLSVTNMQNPKEVRFKIQVSGMARA